MELQVQQPSSLDFDFNNGRLNNNTPSTPKGFGEFYFSAPTSPARSSEIYRQFEEFSLDNGDDFAFITNKESKSIPSAEELIHGGKIQIRPLKTPQEDEIETPKSPLLSPQSKKSQRKKGLLSSFSPKIRGVKEPKSSNPFQITTDNNSTEQGRGRDRNSSSSSGRTVTRSLSPSSKSSRKWRFKDFLLFRSASEGRALDKDPFKKYAYNLYRKHEVAKTENSSIVNVTKKGAISAHELHYTVNKAISQDMKKKSFLPYKQGILGRLAFNPTVHALAHGFGSLAHTHGHG